jgi:uncharacterized repeat protein (TIGR03943 family)
VISAWALLFVYLLAADASSRYLGPRTLWVVPFGAVTLGLAAVASWFFAVRERPTQHPPQREVLGALVLLLPILAVVAVPDAELGAQAAAKKQVAHRVVALQVGAASRHGSPAKGGFASTDFFEISLATLGFNEANGPTVGDRVQLEGIVAHKKTPEGTFALVRFLVSCCVADAIAYRVPIDPGGITVPADDTWLRVTGTMTIKGDNLVVLAERLERIPRPKNPYTYAWD